MFYFSAQNLHFSTQVSHFWHKYLYVSSKESAIINLTLFIAKGNFHEIYLMITLCKMNKFLAFWDPIYSAIFVSVLEHSFCGIVLLQG